MTDYSIVPVAAEPHLAKDLIEYFVASMLKAGSVTNFVDGIPDNNATEDLTKIYLLPFYLEDKPANCGVVRVADRDPDGESPIRQASVTVAFRQKASGTFSAQRRALAAAEALAQFLRPDGVVRTYATLASGRIVLAFKNVVTRPEGEDGDKRFTATVEFDIMYRDINVP